MKLPVSEYQLETNIENTHNLKITAKYLDKILTFMRDNIYDDPKKSCFKEIFSNAIDAHVEHNVQRPVEITLPNTFNRNLIIRDFGKGLSKDFMMNGYLDVGHSTKDTSNLQLGGYGVGRLAPLSYTDIYFIESFTEIENSKDTNYCMYQLALYDAEGVRKVDLKLIDECTCDEPTGFKVSIPIKDKDRKDFEFLVKEHCLYLHNQTPLINLLTANTSDKLLEGKDGTWYTTSNEKGGYLKSCITFLIGGMPNVIEDVEKYTEPNLFSTYGGGKYDYLKYINLVINVPIGSVTQTASKDIQKGELTKKTLSELCHKAHNEILDCYKEKLEKCNNLDEACKLVYNFPKKNLLSWNDISFNDNYVLLKNCTVSKISKRARSRKLYFEKLDNTFPIIRDSKTYIKDIRGISVDDLYNYLNGKVSSVYLITPHEGFTNTYNFSLLSSIISKEEVESKLIKNKSSYRRKVDTSLMSAYKLRSNRELLLACATNKVRVPKEPETIHYYLPLTKEIKSKLKRNEYYQNFSYYQSIYLIEDISKANHSNWINFDDYVINKVESLVNSTPDLLDYISLYEYTREPLDNLLRFSMLDILDGEILELQKYITNIKNHYYTFNTSDKYIVKIYLKNREEVENQLLTKLNDLNNKYPLLLKWDYSNHRLTLEEINTYITQVNNK